MMPVADRFSRGLATFGCESPSTANGRAVNGRAVSADDPAALRFLEHQTPDRRARIDFDPHGPSHELKQPKFDLVEAHELRSVTFHSHRTEKAGAMARLRCVFEC